MIIIKEQNEHIPKAIAIVSSALSLPTNSLTSSLSHNQLALMPVWIVTKHNIFLHDTLVVSVCMYLQDFL